MERKRQFDRNFFICKLSDFIGISGRRYRDMAGADIEPAVIVQKRNGLDNILIIQHRFTHSHEHDVRYSSIALPLGLNDLIDNLARCKISCKAHGSGSAKFAIERTAHLGGHAQCQPFFKSGRLLIGRNENAFNRHTVFELKKEFYRAILRNVLCCGLQVQNRCRAFQGFTEFL